MLVLRDELLRRVVGDVAADAPGEFEMEDDRVLGALASSDVFTLALAWALESELNPPLDEPPAIPKLLELALALALNV